MSFPSPRDIIKNSFLIYPYWNVNSLVRNPIPRDFWVSNLSILECKLLNEAEEVIISNSF